jgi:hypothetical protein
MLSPLLASPGGEGVEGGRQDELLASLAVIVNYRKAIPALGPMYYGLREGKEEGGREGGREGRREGEKEGRREGGKEGRKEGGRKDLGPNLFLSFLSLSLSRQLRGDEADSSGRTFTAGAGEEGGREGGRVGGRKGKRINERWREDTLKIEMEERVKK